jgi:hypothetical protein
MDLVVEDLTIPARASHFAYQVESPNDGAGDTIVHFFGALLSDGEASFCTGSVSGRVWQDDDGDGVEDGTEPGLGGVSVELSDAIGPVETASTDETGAFSFPVLCAGDYVVTVDETTLPPGLRSTTCAGGDCSPLTVALATDESAVSGIAFGWAAQRVPSAGCYFGLGFWKHEYGVMTGMQNGRQHLEQEVLAGLLRHVDDATALDWTRGDGSLDPSDAFAVLVENGSTPCANAARQYFVALLNFAYNGAYSSLAVDTNADGATDMTFGEAIDTVEALFAQGGDDVCRQAKRIANSINAMPSGECSF